MKNGEKTVEDEDEGRKNTMKRKTCKNFEAK